MKSAVEDLVYDHNIDSTSPFVVGVMSVLDTIRSPMHGLHTAYNRIMLCGFCIIVALTEIMTLILRGIELIVSRD